MSAAEQWQLIEELRRAFLLENAASVPSSLSVALLARRFKRRNAPTAVLFFAALVAMGATT
jgi:hypothetical protein